MRYGLLLFALAACSGSEPLESTGPRPPLPDRSVRVVLFGDSNTDLGFDGSVVVEASYISPIPQHLSADAPNGAHQLSGLLEALNTSRLTIKAINHGLVYSGSGVGFNWAPGARYVQGGISRFDAEVLGRGRPTWDGDTHIPRVQAIAPTADDFVYVSMGTNDSLTYDIGPDSTADDLAWMVNEWTNAGLPASHFIITTLPPVYGRGIPADNARIRALASKRGLSLIDLSAYLSPDDGESWRAPELTVGDYLHYSTPVRAWLASQIRQIVLRSN